MLELYTGQPLTFPFAGPFDAEELKEIPGHGILFRTACAVDTNEDGVTTTIYPLSELKRMYGVTAADPETALAECEAERIRRETETEDQTATINDLQAQIDALVGA